MNFKNDFDKVEINLQNWINKLEDRERIEGLTLAETDLLAELEDIREHLDQLNVIHEFEYE